MNLNIVANSTGFLLLGLGIIMGGVVAAAVLQAFWPLLFILLGLVFTVRLEKDPIGVKLAELNQLANFSAKGFDKQLCGTVGDYFFIAPFNMGALEAAESLREPTSIDRDYDAGSLAKENAAASPNEIPSGIQTWRVCDIERVTFATDGSAFTIVQANAQSEQRFQNTGIRDWVLKRLKLTAHWKIDKQYRKVFQLNFAAALLCLPVMFFSMAVVFTSLGIVQPNQLPLNNWNDLKNVRGKARGYMTVWVFLCESYLFLVNKLPGAAALVLGLAMAIAGGVLLYAAQWTKVADTTWWHPTASRS